MPKGRRKPHSLTLEGCLIPLLCGHAVRLSGIPGGFMSLTSSTVHRCSSVGHSVSLSSWSPTVGYPSSGFKMQALRIPFLRLAACLQMMKIPAQWQNHQAGTTYEVSPVQSYKENKYRANRRNLQRLLNKKATRNLFTLFVLIINKLQRLKTLPKPRVAGSSPVYRSLRKWLEISVLLC